MHLIIFIYRILLLIVNWTKESSYILQVMVHCWTHSAEERPGFNDTYQEIQMLIQEWLDEEGASGQASTRVWLLSTLYLIIFQSVLISDFPPSQSYMKEDIHMYLLALHIISFHYATLITKKLKKNYSSGLLNWEGVFQVFICIH